VVAGGAAVLVGLGSPEVAVVADGVEALVGDGAAGEDADGKNGTHRARAADARWRSTVIAFCALVTRRWAWARLVPAPVRPDGLATRGVVVAVAVGVETGAAAVAREVPVDPVEAAVGPVVPVVPEVPDVPDVAVVWSDSRVALALAREAAAEVTALRRGMGSRVASSSPAVTVSPTATDRLETVPATAKPWLTWLTR